MGTEYPESPRAAVGAIVMRGGRVLLVERGNPPAQGVWAIPGGSVELGETMREAAEREVLEETGVRIRAGELVHAFDSVVRDDDGRVRFHYVILDFAAEDLGGEVVAGGDAADARFVSREESRGLRINRATVELLRELHDFFGDAEARRLDSPPRRK